MNRDAALSPAGSPPTLRRCVARADAPARHHCAFDLRGCCSAGRCAPWSAHMNRQRKASSQRVSSKVNTCPAPIEPIPDLSSVRSWLSKLVEETARQRLPELLGELEVARAMGWARLVSLSLPDTTRDAAPSAFCTAQQMAEQLQVPESWIRDQARRGKVPSVRLGHYVRFQPAEVLAALRAQGKR
jgi:excisionase family DNA binding protein